jgi:ActR/RegA family two-component response regulator
VQFRSDVQQIVAPEPAPNAVTLEPARKMDSATGSEQAARYLAATPSPTFAVPSLARVEWEHIQRVLADCGGNLSQAARLLGIHRRSLQRKLWKDPVPENQ